MDVDILYLGIRALGESLQKRTFSPVELTESYLERSERLGPTLNAYATLTRDLALEQARAAEREISRGHYRGPLHGIPYAVFCLKKTERKSTRTCLPLVHPSEL